MLALLRDRGFGLPSGTVTLAEPDPRWAEGARAVLALLPAGPRWEHVGSTSVPDLPAKPILDVLGITHDLAASDALREPLEAAGFTWMGEYGIPGRRYARLASDGVDYVHVHLFPADNPGPSLMLRFRDRLRADPEALAGYAALKRGLAATHAADRTAYTDGKAGWIAGVLR